MYPLYVQLQICSTYWSGGAVCKSDTPAGRQWDLLEEEALGECEEEEEA